MRAIATLLLCVFLAQSISYGVDEEHATPGFSVEKDVPINMLFGQYHMVVDLGALPMGETGIVKLNFINNHQVTFPVDELEIGCKCASAKMSVNEIAPNSSALLTVELKTPTRYKSETVTNSLALVSKADKSKNVSVAMRYSLSGLMAFATMNYAQEVDPSLDSQTILVPFVITQPILASDVKFQIIPETHGAVASLVEEDGGRFMKLVFDPAFVPEEGLAISVVARNEAHDTSDSLPLLLCKRKHVEITPRTIRFRAEGENFVGECLLRYRPPKFGGDLPADESAMSIEASFGDMQLDVQTKKIGRGIYRVSVKGARDNMEEKYSDNNQPNVVWRIVAPDKLYSANSPALVDPVVSQVLEK
jgi:hypothetical protein